MIVSENKNEMLSEFIELEFLTPENAEFSMTENGFLMMSKNGNEKIRVDLLRAFPNDSPYNYISVIDSDKNELGIIKNTWDFDKATEKILKLNLDRRYYVPKIVEIIALEEKIGSSYWTVKTENGLKTFTVKDTFKGIIKIGEDKIIIVDDNSNRYQIESLTALDKKSMRKIELYL